MANPSKGNPKTEALLILYPGFNTLDVNGPLEVLRKSGMSEHFCVTVASQTEITTSAEGAHLKRDIPIDHELFNNLSTYDLLIVPGGLANSDTDPVIKIAKDRDDPFMKLIYAFSRLPVPSPEQNSRILLSICTAAVFLANLGIFDSLYCTTHWGLYSTLPTFLQSGAVWAQGQPGTLLPARYVDSGLNSHGIRIISSGGISCGIDASLHVVRARYGNDEALDTAQLLDYAWRVTDGVVMDAKF